MASVSKPSFLLVLFLLSWNVIDSLLSLSNSWILSKPIASSSPFLLAVLQNLLALLFAFILSHVSLQTSPFTLPPSSLTSSSSSSSPLSSPFADSPLRTRNAKALLIGVFSGLFSGLCILADSQTTNSGALLGSLGALEPLTFLLLSFAMRLLQPAFGIFGAVAAASMGLLLPVIFQINASGDGVVFTLMALVAKATQIILTQTLFLEGDSHLHLLSTLCSIFQASGAVHLLLFLCFELGAVDLFGLVAQLIGPLLLNSVTYFSWACITSLVLRSTSVLAMSLSQILRQILFLSLYSLFSDSALSSFQILGLATSAVGCVVSFSWKVKGFRAFNSSASMLLILLSTILCFTFLSLTRNPEAQPMLTSSSGATVLLVHFFSPLNSPLLWRKLQTAPKIVLETENTKSTAQTNPNMGVLGSLELDPHVAGVGSESDISETGAIAVPTLPPQDPLFTRFREALGTPLLPPRPSLPPSSAERVQISPLFVGTLRSGLNQVFRALKKADLDFKMEGFGKDGAVSWRHAREDADSLRRKSIVPFPVFHIVRHPLSVVFEVQATCLCESLTMGEEEKYQTRELMGNATGIIPSGSLMEQGLRHWVDWNLLIQKHFSTALLAHSESLSFRVLRDNLRTSDNYSLFPWSRPILYLPPRNILEFSWERLEGEVPGDLIDQAKSLSNDYFYAKQPPKTVTIFSYNCDDQVHYLRDFLAREPYSADRPLRFVYKQLRAKSDRILQPSDIVPYSILMIKTEPGSWEKFQTLFATLNNTALVMAHKDEFCEFSPTGLHGALSYRGYWDSKMVNGKKTLWFPLGVRKVFPRVFPHEIQPTSKRPYVFNLIASLSTSPSRVQLVNVVNGIHTPHFMHTVKDWNADFKGYLEPQEYKRKLLESVFTLSPRGHNVECYRIYEACEAGSIPIVEDWKSEPGEKSCLNSLEPFKVSGAPFIYIKDWATLPDLISELIRDPEELMMRQIKLMEWYRAFTTRTITDFENTLSSLWD